MTLDEMCRQVAVYTDRADDFVKITLPNGKQGYDPEDDPGMWFEAMKKSINTAYMEVARTILMPDRLEETALEEGGELDLADLDPAVLKFKKVWNADKTFAYQYDFLTKFRIKVQGGYEGLDVIAEYCYAPEPLEKFTDEPEFSEGLVDPMVYISLACADIWLMERKIQPSQEWRTRYYQMLNSVRKDVKSAEKSRIKRARFR